MNFKKFASIGLAVAAFCSFALAGCTDNGGGDNTPSDEPAIRLRSNAEQALKVGESMTIVYSVANTDEGVTFTSSDDDVVTVSAFGEVEAVGVGEADVTIALVEDASKTAVVSFTVTKNFFMDQNGYRNGQVDLTQQDAGTVTISGGQAQILVNDAGRTWYFSTHITHEGVVAGDSAGGWGVGSFLVNAAYAIGDVMYWYALRRSGDDDHAKLWYGGWRYDASVSASHEELVSDELIDISNGVDFTIYRDGITHYMILEYEEGGETKTIKHSYDVPLFEPYDTFPGVFAQNQMLTVTDYRSSSDPDTVHELLAEFQLAESVEINALDDRLIRGGTYELTSTVLPEYTIDKGVTYSLDTAVAGVTLEGNALTVSEDCSASQITVIASATSDPSVTDEQTYRIIAKPSSTSSLFDTGMAIGDVSFGADSATASGAAYIPLAAGGETWYLESTVDTDTIGAEVGLMSASAGYTYRSAFGVSYANGRVSAAVYKELGGTSATIASAANGLLASDSTNTLGLLKQGDTYTLFINGKMIDRFTAYGSNTVPVLYTTAAAAFTDVSVTTQEPEIAQLLEANPFFTGAYVTRSGEQNNVYSLAGMDFGSENNINWPPVNDYQNGLKYAQSLTGDFEISFTMSDVKPYVQGDGSVDAKVLVYLRSETTTCSLQFVIKQYDGEIGVKFVANLNDNSWTEYDIPAIEGVDLLNGTTQVRIVRTDAGVELYLNGTRVFEDEAFMRNSSYWNETTVSTPGIGSFLCAVTITDPVVTPITQS